MNACERNQGHEKEINVMQQRNLSKLNSCKNAREFMNKIMSMPKREVKSLFGSLSPYCFSKGDKVVRARTSLSGDDPWAIRPWSSSDSHGRFDERRGILYAAGSKEFLPRELGLSNGDQYFLGVYTVTNPFCVGTLLFCDNNFPNISRYLNEICKATHIKNISDGLKSRVLSVKDSCGHLITPYIAGVEWGNELYKYTNWIGNHMVEAFHNGFMYASSYNPVDIAIGDTTFRIVDGIECSNFALTGRALAFLQKPQEHEIQKYIFDEKTPTADAAILAVSNL